MSAVCAHSVGKRPWNQGLRNENTSLVQQPRPSATSQRRIWNKTLETQARFILRPSYSRIPTHSHLLGQAHRQSRCFQNRTVYSVLPAASTARQTVATRPANSHVLGRWAFPSFAWRPGSPKLAQMTDELESCIWYLQHKVIKMHHNFFKCIYEFTKRNRVQLFVFQICLTNSPALCSANVLILKCLLLKGLFCLLSPKK